MSVHEATQNGAGFVLAGNDHSYLMSAGKARTQELQKAIS